MSDDFEAEDLPMRKILLDIIEDINGSKDGPKEEEKRGNGMVKLRIGKKSDDGQSETPEKRMGMTTASIRFLNSEKMRRALAVQRVLLDIERLYRKSNKKPKNLNMRALIEKVINDKK